MEWWGDLGGTSESWTNLFWTKSGLYDLGCVGGETCGRRLLQPGIISIVQATKETQKNTVLQCFNKETSVLHVTSTYLEVLI